MNRLCHIILLATALAAPATFAQFDGRLRPSPSIDELEQKAKEGDAESQLAFGLTLIQGQGGENSSKAQGALWIQKAAKQGHAKAMHILALLYEDGVGVAKDPTQAANWYQKAAEKDLPEAQTAIALAYLTGKGVQKDESLAVEWAMKAASKGHSPGQAIYGSMLARGDGTPKNASKAAVWFLRAAKQNHPYAQRQLAYLYYTGDGVPLDYARCEAWYRRAAANAADPWAMNDLAWFLSTCPDTEFHDGREAVALAKKAVRAIQEDSGDQRHEIIDTMAAALARNGQFGEAIALQRRSLQLLEEDKELEPEGRTKLKTEFEGRLKLYQEQKAYSDEAPKPEKKGAPLPDDDVLDGAPGQSPPGSPPPSGTTPKKKKGSVI